MERGRGRQRESEWQAVGVSHLLSLLWWIRPASEARPSVLPLQSGTRVTCSGGDEEEEEEKRNKEKERNINRMRGGTSDGLGKLEDVTSRSRSCSVGVYGRLFLSHRSEAVCVFALCSQGSEPEQDDGTFALMTEWHHCPCCGKGGVSRWTSLMTTSDTQTSTEELRHSPDINLPWNITCRDTTSQSPTSRTNKVFIFFLMSVCVCWFVRVGTSQCGPMHR